jgi:hypothetical protein
MQSVMKLIGPICVRLVEVLNELKKPVKYICVHGYILKQQHSSNKTLKQTSHDDLVINFRILKQFEDFLL